MHNAPSVSYPVGRSLLAGGFLGGVWLLGVAAIALWAVQTAGPNWRHGLGSVLLLLTGVVAVWHWRKSPSGVLTWDGHNWFWDVQPGVVTVHLDLQALMLVRWQGEASARWLCLERSASSARWNALRRAVYSRAIPDTLQVPQPAAKK